MTSLDKKKKSKKNKKGKQKKAEAKNEGEVLERVMSSIEMAGASLDFFEEGEGKGESPLDEKTELDVALADMSGSSKTETKVQGDSLEMDEHTENGDLLEEESGLEFIDEAQAFSIIESLLFSSERPLGVGTFKQVFRGTNLKSKEIKKALEKMQSVYADSSRGVSLEEINGGWQLRTKVDNMDYLRKLAKARPFKLSGPALEVLAIIAYKQPLVKSEVDQIRGVESGHLVRALMEKHLVCFQGKSELPGKPMQYGTTRKFLEIFGLRNLRELPSLDEIDQLLPDGIGIEEEEEKLSDVTEKMSEQYAGNYSEGEEELIKIQDTLEGIDTSSEFFEEEKRRQKEKRDRDRAQDIREALDVGEDVDPKDERWLSKYDEKMAAAATAANTDELSDLITPSENISEELSSLSAGELVDPEVMKADEAFEEQDETLAGSMGEESEANEDLKPWSPQEPELDPFSEIDDEDGN